MISDFEEKPPTYIEHIRLCNLFGVKPRNAISFLVWKRKRIKQIKQKEKRFILSDVEKAAQEFEDNLYHPLMKPEISDKAKITALACLQEQIGNDTAIEKLARGCRFQKLTLEQFESVCEAVHNGWWKECKRQGRTNQSDMIPYEQLRESVKEYDRVTVRRVLDALDITYNCKPEEVGE